MIEPKIGRARQIPNGGKGRPPGATNKTTRSAREAFQHAFDKIGGAERLALWAKDNEAEFYKLYGRLIPVDVNASGNVGLKIELVRFGDDPASE